MCSENCINFVKQNITKPEIFNRDIIEIGSYNVNGTVKPLIISLNPRKYVGVDIQTGPNVDILCDAEQLLSRFKRESFDGLISTELMEHVKNWQLVISNFKNIIKPGGFIIITTRSKGFPLHNYPEDYWRYEEEDIRIIFSDFNTQTIQRDSTSPGISIKTIKPINFKEINLEHHKLLSILDQTDIELSQ